jgi:hypothetical protein
MTKADSYQFVAKPKLAMGAIRPPWQANSFCAALPGDRVVRSGGRKSTRSADRPACRSDAVRQLQEAGELAQEVVQRWRPIQRAPDRLVSRRNHQYTICGIHDQSGPQQAVRQEAAEVS